MVLAFWPPPETTPVTVKRPQPDSRGNPNYVEFQIDAVVSLQAAMSRPRLGAGQENRFIQDSAIYIQRGATVPDGTEGLDADDPALQAGDEVVYQGENFTIAGDMRSNQNHPLTRMSLGWTGFRMQGVG